MDLNQPMTTQVDIEVPNIGSTSLDVAYRSLPSTCDFYWEKGHTQRLCYAKYRQVEHDLLKTKLAKAKSQFDQRAQDTKGFIKVTPRHSPKESGRPNREHVMNDRGKSINSRGTWGTNTNHSVRSAAPCWKTKALKHAPHHGQYGKGRIQDLDYGDKDKGAINYHTERVNSISPEQRRSIGQNYHH